jgi:23S rRNA pseudouridine2605 synthase
MSRESSGPRKTFSKGGSSDFNKRKSFSSSDKPKRPYKKREDGDESRPRKTFGDDEKKSFSGEKRTFGKRQDGSFRSKSSGSFGDKEKRPYSSERKPFTKRDDSGSESRPRRSFGDGESKPFVKRADGKYESASPRKSFGDASTGSSTGERKPYAKRDASTGSATGEKRSYTRRDDSSSENRPRRSFGDGERKPFVKREDGKYESAGPRKSFGDASTGSATGERKPYAKRGTSTGSATGEKRSYTKRDDSFSDRKPRSSFNDGERKPYAKRDDSFSDRKPRSSFNDGERKPFEKREGDFTEKRESKSFGDRPRKMYDDDKKPYTPRLSKPERVVERSKKAGPSKTSTQKNVSDGAVRLNRYVANSGVCSRREADVLIATGVVTVNGKIVTEMGYKVNPTDVVSYGGVPIKNEVKKYLLLNKPKDYITTMDDPEERKTVMELTRNACKERLYPVGRLDRNTTGILLFTNDGDMTAKLTHPKFLVRKIYHVILDKKITSEDFKHIAEGVELSDGLIKPDALEYVGEGKSELGVEIHSGRNRIVRRMFEHLGYEVMKLDRVAFAGLTKKDLPRGKFRFLTEKEIDFLKMLG